MINEGSPTYIGLIPFQVKLSHWEFGHLPRDPLMGGLLCY